LKRSPCHGSKSSNCCRRTQTRRFKFLRGNGEEIIAGAYKKAGFEEVTLTPCSGDHGRDIIAVKRGLGRICVIDQVKAYNPNHLVTADEVRALMGVLHGDSASKGFLTTTSDFAPRLRQDPLITPFMPARLESPGLSAPTPECFRGLSLEIGVVVAVVRFQLFHSHSQPSGRLPHVHAGLHQPGRCSVASWSTSAMTSWWSSRARGDRPGFKSAPARSW
jgi:hypothetical protein